MIIEVTVQFYMPIFMFDRFLFVVLMRLILLVYFDNLIRFIFNY